MHTYRPRAPTDRARQAAGARLAKTELARARTPEDILMMASESLARSQWRRGAVPILHSISTSARCLKCKGQDIHARPAPPRSALVIWYITRGREEGPPGLRLLLLRPSCTSAPALAVPSAFLSVLLALSFAAFDAPTNSSCPFFLNDRPFAHSLPAHDRDHDGLHPLAQVLLLSAGQIRRVL